MHHPIPIAIIGASGYTGAELVRLLAQHPNVEIKVLAAESSAGQPIAAIYPHLAMLDLPPLIKIDHVFWDDVDLAFFCLPHGISQSIIPNLPHNVRIIDLSADFRLYDLSAYEKWYGHAHQAPSLQKEAVYGLPEMFRETIHTARLVACPGCYPTTAMLPLIPLLSSGKILPDRIIIDAKSGITGAGRSAKAANLFSEVNEGVRAYGIGTHRHNPEIEQALSAAADQRIEVIFTPQVVPMNRGILETIYVRMEPGLDAFDLRETLVRRFKDEPFVHIAAEGHAPSTREVMGTNYCVINVFPARTPGDAIIVSVIDNLIKGASGQAVQNLNIMQGWPEITALTGTALFP